MAGFTGEGRRALPATNAGDVLRRDALGLRFRARRHGTVLLSQRSASLPRYLVLPRSAAPVPRLRQRQGLRILPGLRDRPRGRSPRAESARHPAEGAAAPARRRQGRGQPFAGPGRAAGRLFCRGLGQKFPAALESGRAGRHRSRAQDRGRHRRRPPAAAGARLRRPRRIHPRLFRAAHALVQLPSSACAGSTPGSRAVPWRAATPSGARSSRGRERCRVWTRRNRSCR